MAGRSWAGTTLADRRAERRRALLAAGLELAGTEGSAAVTVRSVCRVARLTDRYFYENFDDRDALLLAVFDEVADEAGRVLLDSVAAVPGDGADRPAAVARAAVDAFLDLLTDDPRKARVLLVEPLADPVLGERGAALTPVFADIIRAQIDGDETDALLTGAALVGAMANLFAGWLGGGLAVSRERLADYSVRLLVAAMSVPGRGRA